MPKKTGVLYFARYQVARLLGINANSWLAENVRQGQTVWFIVPVVLNRSALNRLLNIIKKYK